MAGRFAGAKVKSAAFCGIWQVGAACTTLGAVFCHTFFVFLKHNIYTRFFRNLEGFDIKASKFYKKLLKLFGGKDYWDLKQLRILQTWKAAGLAVLFLLWGWGWDQPSLRAEEAIITGASVYVRSGPGTSYDIIGSLSRDTGIDIMERQNGWVKISFGNRGGWVAERLTGSNTSKVQLSGRIYINGEQAAFQTLSSSNGYILVPLREIMKKLGAEVSWDNSSQTVSVRKCATSISWKVGSADAVIDGRVRSIDAPLQIVDGLVFVPLRSAVESLGGKAIWDEQSQEINIYCPSNPGDRLTAVSVATADLNIRESPSTSSSIIGMEPQGTILAYTGEADGWFQVRHRGQLGWVAGWLVVPLWNASVPVEKEPVLLPVPDGPQAFVQQMLPYAKTASAGTGLPVNLLLAQWAEESGYGTSSLAKFYNNYGGIKNPETGGFRKYMTADDFALDVVAVYTQHSNYARLLAHARAGASLQTLLNDLSGCGYASSKNYGEKIRTKYLPEINSALENL